MLNIKKLFVNITRGEKFHKAGNAIQISKFVIKNGSTIAFLNVHRSGFYMWLNEGLGPLKVTGSTFTHDLGRINRAFEGPRGSRNDEVLNKLKLWHR